MSAPNLRVWLPCVRVQLFTNWNCCSLSVNGQLQRPTFKPSPKFGSPSFWAPDAPLFPPMVGKNEDNPPVVGGHIFNPGIPNAVMGFEVASEYAVSGLYLKYPNRKSVSSV